MNFRIGETSKRSAFAPVETGTGESVEEEEAAQV